MLICPSCLVGNALGNWVCTRRQCWSRSCVSCLKITSRLDNLGAPSLEWDVESSSQRPFQTPLQVQFGFRFSFCSLFILSRTFVLLKYLPLLLFAFVYLYSQFSFAVLFNNSLHFQKLLGASWSLWGFSWPTQSYTDRAGCPQILVI